MRIAKLLLALVAVVFSVCSYAQEAGARLVNGIIKDEKGKALQGITVTEKGTVNAVATDEKGAFSIRVKQNATLQLTGIGYEAQEFKANNMPAAITMREDAKALGDVVVVGYGSQKKA